MFHAFWTVVPNNYLNQGEHEFDAVVEAVAARAFSCLFVTFLPLDTLLECLDKVMDSNEGGLYPILILVTLFSLAEDHIIKVTMYRAKSVRHQQSCFQETRSGDNGLVALMAASEEISCSDFSRKLRSIERLQPPASVATMRTK